MPYRETQGVGAPTSGRKPGSGLYQMKFSLKKQGLQEEEWVARSTGGPTHVAGRGNGKNVGLW